MLENGDLPPIEVSRSKAPPPVATHRRATEKPSRSDQVAKILASLTDSERQQIEEEAIRLTDERTSRFSFAKGGTSWNLCLEGFREELVLARAGEGAVK